MCFTSARFVLPGLLGLILSVSSCAFLGTRRYRAARVTEAPVSQTDLSGSEATHAPLEISLEWEILDGKGQLFESAEWAIFNAQGDPILEGQGAGGSVSLGQGRFILQAVSTRTGATVQEVVELGSASGSVKRVRLRVDEIP